MYKNNFYNKKKVMITGNTGFKGTWLSLFLKILGADVIGYADKIPYKKAILSRKSFNKLFKQYWEDIRDHRSLDKVYKIEKPDMIFHLAAQPLVLESYLKPKETFETNFLGTLNILNILKNASDKIPLVIITTDKVYLNKENKTPFLEQDTLMGDCPYSMSKVCAELLTKSYFEIERNMRISTVRAGNVIGGGDWAKDRIIPDILKSIIDKKLLQIRNPHSTRPWIHILDVCYGYALVAEKLYNAKPVLLNYNLAPSYRENYSVKDLMKEIFREFNKKDLIINKVNRNKKEKKYLNLNASKAKKELKWKTNFDFYQATSETGKWYKKVINGESSLKTTEKQIKNYLLNLKINFDYLDKQIIKESNYADHIQ